MSDKHKTLMRKAIKNKRKELLKQLDELTVRLKQEVDPKRKEQLERDIYKLGTKLQLQVYNSIDED